MPERRTADMSDGLSRAEFCALVDAITRPLTPFGDLFAIDRDGPFHAPEVVEALIARGFAKRDAFSGRIAATREGQAIEARRFRRRSEKPGEEARHA